MKSNSNLREDRLKKFNGLHKDLFSQDPILEGSDKNIDPFLARAPSAGQIIPDPALGKQVLHAAVKESLFSNMKPLKAQIESMEEAKNQNSSILSERERRLMLREMERKKRLAGMGNDPGQGYGGSNMKMISEKLNVEMEAQKENKERGNFSNEEENKKEDIMMMKFEKKFSEPNIIKTEENTIISNKLPIQPIISEPPIIQQKEISNIQKRPSSEQKPLNMMDQAYERERQRKERERDIMKNEYLQAIQKLPPKARRVEPINQQNINQPAITAVNVPSAISQADDKRKKQAEYREQLEAQMKAKQKPKTAEKMADDVFNEISRKMKEENKSNMGVAREIQENIQIPIMQQQQQQQQKLTEYGLDRESEEKLKKEAYARELQEQIELKKQKLANEKMQAKAVSSMGKPPTPAVQYHRPSQVENYENKMGEMYNPPLSAMPQQYTNPIPSQFPIPQPQTYLMRMPAPNTIPDQQIFYNSPPPQSTDIPIHPYYEQMPTNYPPENYTIPQPEEPLDFSDKKRKDDYRKFLEAQMNEQKERKKPPKQEFISQAPASLPQPDQTPPASLDPEKQERIRKLQSQQFMQEELKRQMEEKEQRKKAEKQKKKEEDEKEFARLKKEQEEIARKIQADKEASNTGKTAENGKNALGAKWVQEQKRKLFEPSVENPISRKAGDTIKTPINFEQEIPKMVPQPIITAQPIAEEAKFENEGQMPKYVPFDHNKPEPIPENSENNEINPFAKIEQMKNLKPINPELFPKLPSFLQNDISAGSGKSSEGSYEKPMQVRDKLLEGYQKQLEELKSEKQLAREEALLYKEQLIREREIRVQQMIDKFQQNQAGLPPATALPAEPAYSALQNAMQFGGQPNYMVQPSAVPLAQPKYEIPATINEEEMPINEPELEQVKKDDNAYMTQLMKSEIKYSEPPTADFDLEESLASDTKLVKVDEKPKDINDLYQTWSEQKIEEMKQKSAEVSIQTSIAVEKLSEIKVPDLIPPKSEPVEIKQSPEKPKIIEEISEEDQEIEEDYSQLEKEGELNEKPKHVKHEENEEIDNKNKEFEDTVKVQMTASPLEIISPTKPAPNSALASPRLKESIQGIKLTDLKQARLNRAKDPTKNAATKMMEALQKDIAEVSLASKASLAINDTKTEVQENKSDHKKWELPPVYKVDSNNDLVENLVENFEIKEEPKNDE